MGTASPKTGWGRVAAALRGFWVGSSRLVLSPETPGVVCSLSWVIPAPKSELGVGVRGVMLWAECRQSRGAERGRTVGRMGCSRGGPCMPPMDGAGMRRWEVWGQPVVSSPCWKTQVLPKFSGGGSWPSGSGAWLACVERGSGSRAEIKDGVDSVS